MTQFEDHHVLDAVVVYEDVLDLHVVPVSVAEEAVHCAVAGAYAVGVWWGGWRGGRRPGFPVVFLGEFLGGFPDAVIVGGRAAFENPSEWQAEEHFAAF